MTPRTWTDQQCPVARTLDLVGDRWVLLIVRDAFDGLTRFSEFQRSLGIAKNILADRLRLLVENGILRRVDTGADARAHYRLTPRGEDLFTVIVGLRQWGERNAFEADEEHSVLILEETGEPLAAIDPVRANGGRIVARDTHVQKV